MGRSTLRVGVIGVGLMGADHAERLASRIAHAELVAVSDPDRAEPGSRAASGPRGAGARCIAVRPGSSALPVT